MNRRKERPAAAIKHPGSSTTDAIISTLENDPFSKVNFVNFVEWSIFHHHHSFVKPSRDAASMNFDRRRQHESTDPG